MGIAGGCALASGQGFDDFTADLVDVTFGALGLVIGPLVGGLGLFQDRLIDGMSGEQRAKRGEHGKHRGGDGRDGHLVAAASVPCSRP